MLLCSCYDLVIHFHFRTRNESARLTQQVCDGYISLVYKGCTDAATANCRLTGYTWGSNWAFGKTEDYGFLSKKKVKTQFLVK